MVIAIIIMIVSVFLLTIVMIVLLLVLIVVRHPLDPFCLLSEVCRATVILLSEPCEVAPEQWDVPGPHAQTLQLVVLGWKPLHQRYSHALVFSIPGSRSFFACPFESTVLFRGEPHYSIPSFCPCRL